MTLQTTMKIHHGLDSIDHLRPGAAATIGNFDGLHVGHLRVLARVRALARGTGATTIAGVPAKPDGARAADGARQADRAGRADGAAVDAEPPGGVSDMTRASDANKAGGVTGAAGATGAAGVTGAPGAAGATVVITFEPHPLTVLRPTAAPPRLTPPGVKQALFAAAGVDHLVVLPPVPGVLGLSAEAFWSVIRDRLRPRHLVEGPVFNFGKDKGGNIALLAEWTAGTGITLHVEPNATVVLGDLTRVDVSSTLVRFLVAHGRMRDAAAALGRPYAIGGTVVRGHQRGRTIGTATANLEVTDQLLPADGVYAGRCAIDGQSYGAALSVGTNPTFDGQTRTAEAHVIGYDGDLYGTRLVVDVLDWLRDTQRFVGVDALKRQINRDIAAASGAWTAEASASASV